MWSQKSRSEYVNGESVVAFVVFYIFCVNKKRTAVAASVHTGQLALQHCRNSYAASLMAICSFSHAVARRCILVCQKNKYIYLHCWGHQSLLRKRLGKRETKIKRGCVLPIYLISGRLMEFGLTNNAGKISTNEKARDARGNGVGRVSWLPAPLTR